MADAIYITRIILRHYKSIASCDVRLGSLTFLVGPNGAGKSNFLDAFAFVARALRDPLEFAIRERGGIQEVCQRPGPGWFGIRLEFWHPQAGPGHYSIRIGARRRSGFEVLNEEFVLNGSPPSLGFRARGGHLIAWWGPTAGFAAQVPSDQLYAPKEPRVGYGQWLSRMACYRLNPDAIRGVHKPDLSDSLHSDGGNITSLLARLTATDEIAMQRIEHYLGQIVPGISGVQVETIGQQEVLKFRQQVQNTPQLFSADSMSEGTLRALGILTALFQRRQLQSTLLIDEPELHLHPVAIRVLRDALQKNDPGDLAALFQPILMVGIEEPELALHPAAAGILRDALREASQQRQVMVTSHSPDLLDDEDIDTASLVAVRAEEGVTHLGHLDEASRSALRDHLYTAGELLRMDQINPARDAGQPVLFDSEEGL